MQVSLPLQTKKFPTEAAPTPSKVECQWNLLKIPKIPELYHVGRSRVTVSNCEGHTIVSRVTDCLRQQSLSVTFEENTAVCETCCHAKLIVKIFEDSNGFLVEVQRRKGCAVTCQKLSRAILRAAKGLKLLPKPRTFTVPSSILQKNQQLKEGESKEEDTKNVLNMIKQEKDDVRMLGMSALVNITDKDNISMEESKFDFLSKLILSQPYSHENMEQKLRLDALTVLGNMLTQKSIRAQFVIDNGLLHTLVTDLVDNNLHISYQAARCMTAISRFDPFLRVKISSLVTKTAVDDACAKGLASHKLLESEIQQLKLLSSIV